MNTMNGKPKELKKMQVATDLEHTHPHPEFWKGWNRIIEEIFGEAR